jgi:hypothetical protein
MGPEDRYRAPDSQLSGSAARGPVAKLSPAFDLTYGSPSALAGSIAILFG